MSSKQFRAEIGTHGSGALLPPPQNEKRLSTPYDFNYEQYLNDFGVSLQSKAKPDNWQELKARLARRRSSLSGSRFSEEDFENFKENNTIAATEADAMANVIPIIKGNLAIPSCHKRVFNNLKPLDRKLAAAQPDFYDGSRPADLDLHVRDDIGEYITPSKRPNTLLLPNFFLEINGLSGNPQVLKRQVSRNLAFGARGMLEIQSYSNRGRKYDNNAYTIGSIYNGGSGLLRFFTMYLTQPADPTGQPTYHMIEIKSFLLTGDAEACCGGIGLFRNSREFAKEVRDGAIASANKMAHDLHHGGSSSTSTNHPPVLSSTSGVAGLVPGSWLGGPSTSQAQEAFTTPSGSGHEEPRRSMVEPSGDAGSSLGWRRLLLW